MLCSQDNMPATQRMNMMQPTLPPARESSSHARPPANLGKKSDLRISTSSWKNPECSVQNINEVDAEVDHLSACNKLNGERIYTWPSSLQQSVCSGPPSDRVRGPRHLDAHAPSPPDHCPSSAPDTGNKLLHVC
ncbi:unnamed protein product [Pleuronectes platessa]|uniref:Uncharacterized protein n=1 Tax=Pleuronectes platessa TaxID=8262 RepID=A0A9N7TK68_PLEPL|nr:unnamed protein product [Pleuronectes platessa]